MKISDEPVKGWEQLQITSSGAYELTLRVGVMPYDDHVQIELEILDAVSGELLTLRSAPHRRLDGLSALLAEWTADLTEATLKAAEPF